MLKYSRRSRSKRVLRAATKTNRSCKITQTSIIYSYRFFLFMNWIFFFFTNKHSQVTLRSQLCFQFKKFKFGGMALLTHFKLCGQSCHSSYIPPTTFSLPKMIKSHVAACLHCSLAKPCTTKPKLSFFSPFPFFSPNGRRLTLKLLGKAVDIKELVRRPRAVVAYAR